MRDFYINRGLSPLTKDQPPTVMVATNIIVANISSKIKYTVIHFCLFIWYLPCEMSQPCEAPFHGFGVDSFHIGR